MGSSCIKTPSVCLQAEVSPQPFDNPSLELEPLQMMTGMRTILELKVLFWESWKSLEIYSSCIIFLLWCSLDFSVYDSETGPTFGQHSIKQCTSWWDTRLLSCFKLHSMDKLKKAVCLGSCTRRSICSLLNTLGWTSLVPDIWARYNSCFCTGHVTALSVWCKVIQVAGWSSLLDLCYALLVPSHSFKVLCLQFCMNIYKLWVFLSEHLSLSSFFFCVAPLYDNLIDLRIRPTYASVLFVLFFFFFKSKNACCVIILFVFGIISPL